MNHEAEPKTELDLVILGAGPAGLSAAIVARVLGLRSIVLDTAQEPGGQLLQNPTPLFDVPGIDAPSGPALAAHFFDSAEKAGAKVLLGQKIEGIELRAGTIGVGGETLRPKFILLATGARRRTLGIPGERDEVGRGPSPLARQYGKAYEGRTVLVVGGGDLAVEEAGIFARTAARVILAHRGSRLRARHDFKATLAACNNAEVRLETTLLAIEGEPHVEAAVLQGPTGTYRERIDAVFICVGIAPNSELVRGEVETDSLGYIVTDRQQRSSEPRLYAAGDVCAGSAWSVAAAIGQAAIAIKDMERRLNAEESW